MEKYCIKNNLPSGIINPVGKMDRKNAAQHFIGLINHLNTNNYQTKVVFRNEKNKPLRGTIQVEIDYFYYYVELYKTEA